MPDPFSNPDIRCPELRNLFRWMRESPGWREEKRGVLWDFRCQQCGLTIEKVSCLGQTVAERDGVRICQRKNFQVLCTRCVPIAHN